MSVSSRLLKSSAFMFLARVINRSIGLVSTFVLARMLTPDDFGVVAIATIVAFFFDAISNSGMREYVIQKEVINDETLNSAWTLNIIIKITVWLIFSAAVPFIAEFYDNSELIGVLLFISLILPIRAFENVGLALHRKELNYGPVFRLELTQKVISFGFMLILLLMLDSYWIMLSVMVCNQLVALVGSYVVHPYRPSLCFSNIYAQWRFSKWLIPNGAIGFLKSEFDALMVSRFFSLGQLGGFNLMKSLTNMVGRDIIVPATEPLLSAFSSSKRNLEHVSFQSRLSFLVVSLLILPVVGFMYAQGGLIIRVLYGDQWVEFSTVLSILTPLVLIYGFSGVLQNLLLAHHRTKPLFYFELFGLGAVVMLLLAVNPESLDYFAFLRVALAVFLMTLVLFYVNTSLVQIKLLRLLGLLVPVFLSVWGAMFIQAIFVPILGSDIPLINLLLGGAVFLFSYVLLVAVWAIALKQWEEVGYVVWLVRKQLQKLQARN